MRTIIHTFKIMVYTLILTIVTVSGAKTQADTRDLNDKCFDVSQFVLPSGTETWVILNTPNEEFEIWKSKGSRDQEFFKGIFAAAKAVNKPIILDTLLLRSVEGQSTHSVYVSDKIAKALRIDVNNECQLNK